MYSGSPSVIDALADFIETTVQISDRKVMSQGRVNQVRHIIQVDEQSFKAQFSAHQLKTIESHEMAYIVDELVSAIGLQRFRFTERQKKGTSSVFEMWLPMKLRLFTSLLSEQVILTSVATLLQSLRPFAELGSTLWRRMARSVSLNRVLFFSF